MKTLQQHFWRGDWIDQAELENRIKSFKITSAHTLQIDWLFQACQDFSHSLVSRSSSYQLLAESLKYDFPLLTVGETQQTISELAEFISKRSLQQKIFRELCLSKPQTMPFVFERIDYQTEIFEKWAPMGFVVHIAPSNAINVPFLTLIEGLICGNKNFVKLPSVGQQYTLNCIKLLTEFDASKMLAQFIFAVYLPIQKNDFLEIMIKHADALVVWGSEETVQVFKSMAPLHTQLIAWGPKISFAYFDAENFENKWAINRLAQDICLFDQQSCSSPQVVYLETNDKMQLRNFAKALAAELKVVSPQFSRQIPQMNEYAEITQTETLHKLNQALDPELKETVIKADDNSWRILIDERSGLQASPLYRTIWLKPLLRNGIIGTLRPLRMYLQTVGLQCSVKNVYELSQLLLHAGANRITQVGEMISGYMGEPHDGVYALQRYCRRVSVSWAQVPKGISYLEELAPTDLKNKSFTKFEREQLLQQKLMNANDVLAAQNDLRTEDIQVYFKTGGSSGEPKLSIFTYDDYEMQMKFAAQGLFAAGLDPKSDRCINLFFAGGLYGGFLSFFSILEQLKAVQLPMAADTNFKSVGEWIVKQKINVLLGMPSYLWRLFEENENLFLQYGKIEKVFYGGEHFPEAQRKILVEKFKVRDIRSAAYGSNETGPMGYQCKYCKGSVHHLHDHLQFLEILEIEKDVPVKGEEAGRLILTSKVRQGQNISRYEIGDLGRWVEGTCECGRTSPRFELLGRYGDVFKVGTIFLNYKKFENILLEASGASGPIQIVIPNDQSLILRVVHTGFLDLKAVRDRCLQSYSDLNLVVNIDQMLTFEVQQCSLDKLIYVKSSGKLKSVVDQRKS